jgi:transposase
MPDVISLAPADARVFVALDVHKLSIVAATLPPQGGQPELTRIETTENAIRRFIKKLGGPEGLAVCYEAGPGGFALWRLLSSMGIACDVVAPSLVPVRAGDRVKTDRRDAKKLVIHYRGGLLRFVAPPTPETEGLRDLLRCRDDIRCARTAARHRISKQLLRHGLVYREGKKSWTKAHLAWVRRQRLSDPLAAGRTPAFVTQADRLDNRRPEKRATRTTTLPNRLQAPDTLSQRRAAPTRSESRKALACVRQASASGRATRGRARLIHRRVHRFCTIGVHLQSLRVSSTLLNTSRPPLIRYRPYEASVVSPSALIE